DNLRHPLLERLRFLSISASNLDEFYMVRVAGLKGQNLAGIKTVSQDGLTPAQQLDAIQERAGRLMADQQVTWLSLRRQLADAGDLVRLFETALKRRRRGHVIHLAVDGRMPGELRRFLSEHLDAAPGDVFATEGILGLDDTAELIIADERPDLVFTPYNPRFPERIRDFGGDCFAAIR